MSCQRLNLRDCLDVLLTKLDGWVHWSGHLPWAGHKRCRHLLRVLLDDLRLLRLDVIDGVKTTWSHHPIGRDVQTWLEAANQLFVGGHHGGPRRVINIVHVLALCTLKFDLLIRIIQLVLVELELALLLSEDIAIQLMQVILLVNINL